MLKAVVAFKKAIANVNFNKAIANVDFKKIVTKLDFGHFLIFRFFFDALGLSDSESKSISKSLGDNPNVTDSAATAINKAANDSFATSDVKTLSLSKALADFYAVADSHASSIVKSTIDSSTFTDTENKDFYKVISETAGVTDDLDGAATADDDQDMTFVKVRSNLATIADVISIVKNTLFSDTSALTDSGSVRNQGYCDFSYFKADYVGDSRTF